MRPQDFDEFWAEYPRKCGKLAALRAYEKARKHATADAILAGVMAYKLTMPQEERFRPHPATWLNAGRWMDEIPQARVQTRRDWYEECTELHGNACGLDRWRHMERVEMERMERA